MGTDRRIAGHRVLRLLAQGARSRVWLAEHELVLKVIEPPLPAGQPLGEAAALERAQGDHVVPLLDVSIDDDRAVLIFPRLPRGSLADLLARRAGLDAGEAVTALAPVAQAVARMHAAGVAHTALTAERVLFRADGAPVLTGFGTAGLFEAGLPEVLREREEGVAADRAALVRLAAGVLGRVSGPRSSAAAALAERLVGARAGGDPGALLLPGLFELAAARPLRFEPDAREVPEVVRGVPVAEAVPEPSRESPAVPPVLTRLLESGPGELARRALVARWTALPSRSRRLAVAGGAGFAAMLLLAAVVPGTPAPSPSEAQPDVSAAAAPGASVPAPSEPDPSEPDPTAVDDPLDAVAALFARRTECFRGLSVLCLADVDQDASAAASQDRAALEALIDEGVQPVRLSADGAALVERLGDSALVELTPGSDPASVLLMRTEAGWRIRDYLAAVPDG